MKLICDQCGARYSIADEKVRGKVFKIRCKKCENTIVVQGDMQAPAEQMAFAASAVGDQPMSAGPDEAQAASVYPGAMEAGYEQAGADPYGGAPASEQAPSTQYPDTAQQPVWYVLIGQQQVGPLTDEELGARINVGEATAESYVWKEGFIDWVQLDTLQEFASWFGVSAPAAAVEAFIPGQQQQWDEPPADRGAPDAEDATVAAAIGPSGQLGEEVPGGRSGSPGSGLAAGLALDHYPSGAGMVAGGVGTSPFDTSPADSVFSSSSHPEDGHAMAFETGDGADDRMPGPLAMAPDSSGMIAERHENSVLFSLNNLRNLATGGAEAIVSDQAAAAPSSTSSSSASGLIDIRALAEGDGMGFGDGSPAGAPAPAAPLLAPMMVPMVARRGPPLGLLIGLGAAGVLVIGLAVVVVVLLTRSPQSVEVGSGIGSRAVASLDPGAVDKGKEKGGTASSSKSGTKGSAAAEKGEGSDHGAKHGEEAAARGSSKGRGSDAHRPARPAGARKPARRAASRAHGSRSVSSAKAASAPTRAPVAVPAPQPRRTTPVPRSKPTSAKSEVEDLLASIESGSRKPARPAPRKPAAAKPVSPAPAAAPKKKSLSREDISGVVRANKGRIHGCYTRQPEPKLSGTLMVSFHIQRSGRVGSARIKTRKFEGTPVGQCVLSVVRSFKFPTHTDTPVKINYPFILR